MKRILVISIIMAISMFTLVILFRQFNMKSLLRKSEAVTIEPAPSAGSNAVSGVATSQPGKVEMQGKIKFPNLAERSRMSREERSRLLEKIGFLPDDADNIDCMLAENTSWWGKRLDPKIFWADKVVWYDEIAEWEARRRGRGWPPLPYDDPSVADYSDKDRRAEGHGVESTVPPYVSSDREQVFWEKFIMTHPHPPDDIIHWQRNLAKSWLRSKHILENDPIYAARLRLEPKELDQMLEMDRQEAKECGYPSECLTTNAYFWAYILKKREEYDAEIQAHGGDMDAKAISNFFHSVYVDRKYITEPLSAEDIKAANAWKVAYLRRLRQEKTDESYIQAYLRAWNLSSNEVFSASK